MRILPPDKVRLLAQQRAEGVNPAWVKSYFRTF
jgi:hypothetical protein